MVVVTSPVVPNGLVVFVGIVVLLGLRPVELLLKDCWAVTGDGIVGYIDNLGTYYLMVGFD